MVKVGNIKTFKDVKPDKAQVLKIAEEVCEVYSAWENCDEEALNGDFYHCGETLEKRMDLIDECCDVIQATCNLLASMGVKNLTFSMMKCEERNRKRGRL